MAVDIYATLLTFVGRSWSNSIVMGKNGNALLNEPGKPLLEIRHKTSAGMEGVVYISVFVPSPPRGCGVWGVNGEYNTTRSWKYVCDL